MSMILALADMENKLSSIVRLKAGPKNEISFLSSRLCASARGLLLSSSVVNLLLTFPSQRIFPSFPVVRRRMFLASPLSSSLSRGRETEASGAAVGNDHAPGKPAAKSLARYSSNGFRESLCGTIIIK